MDLAGPQEMDMIGWQETPLLDLAGPQETLVLDLAGPQEILALGLVGFQETPVLDLVLGDQPVPDLVGQVDLLGQLHLQKGNSGKLLSRRLCPENLFKAPAPAPALSTVCDIESLMHYSTIYIL